MNLAIHATSVVDILKFDKAQRNINPYYIYQCKLYKSICHLRGVWFTSLRCSTTKPTKWPVGPARTQISLGIHPDWSVVTVRPEETLGPWGPIECTAKTLVRLGGCPGWFESLLGTLVILLVLSCTGSYLSISFVSDDQCRPWSDATFCMQQNPF